jgi:hypothetical protein
MTHLSKQQQMTLIVNPEQIYGGANQNSSRCNNASKTCAGSINDSRCTNSGATCMDTINGKRCTSTDKAVIALLQ